MAGITLIPLSGKTNHKPIPVTQSGSPGNLVHTCISAANFLDEVWAQINNSSGATVVVTFEFDDGITPVEKWFAVPSDGEYLLINGLPYGDGLIIRVYASVTDGTVVVDGKVNRVDQN